MRMRINRPTREGKDTKEGTHSVARKEGKFDETEEERKLNIDTNHNGEQTHFRTV